MLNIDLDPNPEKLGQIDRSWVLLNSYIQWALGCRGTRTNLMTTVQTRNIVTWSDLGYYLRDYEIRKETTDQPENST